MTTPAVPFTSAGRANGKLRGLFGYGVRAADLPVCTHGHGAVVGSYHDVGVEQGNRRIEVALL